MCVCVGVWDALPIGLYCCLTAGMLLLQTADTHSRTCADPPVSDSPVQTRLLGKYQINTESLQIHPVCSVINAH